MKKVKTKKRIYFHTFQRMKKQIIYDATLLLRSQLFNCCYCHVIQRMKNQIIYDATLLLRSHYSTDLIVKTV